MFFQNYRYAFLKALFFFFFLFDSPRRSGLKYNKMKLRGKCRLFVKRGWCIKIVGETLSEKLTELIFLI